MQGENAMKNLEASIQEIQDRQAIWDALLCYTTGMDRLDRSILERAYHPDAVDDHGGYVGPVSGFFDWAIDLHRSVHSATLHSMSNHSCEIEGNTAHCVTYFSFTGMTTEGKRESLSRDGRYIDRLEKRNGRWAIAVRICVLDCDSTDTDANGAKVDFETTTDLFYPVGRDDTARQDPMFMRPLTIDPARYRIPTVNAAAE